MSELSAAQCEQFLATGSVVVKGAVASATARAWLARAYAQEGIDPGDQRTWTRPRIHVQAELKHAVPAADIAPRAVTAIGELLGGAGRIDAPVIFGDNLVINLSEGSDEPWVPPSAAAPGWHKDGYFFTHFLDSPEQALVAVILWTEVRHLGGPTYIEPDSVGVVARHLAAHPEGVPPGDFGEMITQCSQFGELTGEQGDVILMHPFMLHAISQNTLRVPRVISNPPVYLREPFRYDRPEAELSLVERATLRGLGVQRLEFAPTRARQREWPGWVAQAQARSRAG